MDRKRFKHTAMLATAAAATIYSYVSGKGFFNKTRFKNQHEALSKYVDNNYPDCTYSPIAMHGKGWTSIIKRRGRTVVFVYFTKSPDGSYIFTEASKEFK